MTPNPRQDMDNHLEHEARYWDRRARPSWWIRHSEEIGLLLWIVAFTIAGAICWMAFSKVESWFR